jgi:aspartyl-tRNA(Asn)/glutamyl-tRNA(Gln) amidotransferase subunit C
MQDKIDTDYVRHIAALARLGVDDDELELYAEQMQRILEHVAKIREVDTSGVSPTAQVINVIHRLRDDEPEGCLSADDLKRMAPDIENGFFKVPRIIKYE